MRSNAVCSVKITSKGDNSSENISVDGEYKTVDGGVRVYYISDGDESTFFFKDGYAEYVRAGSQYVRMFFELGKTARSEIGCGDMSGFIEVVTRKLEISSDGSGYYVKLEYSMGQDGEKTELDFTVLKK